MNCIIDVGGGNKGVFADGVFDYLMDNHIIFDSCIGISAGAANCCSYISGQRGRNLKFYTGYSLSSRAIGLLAFLKTRGSFIDLDYIYHTVSCTSGKCPIDFDAYSASTIKGIYVATDALTGEPVYFDKSELQLNDYGAISASSAMPVVCKPYEYKGRKYYDGYLSDPIPIQKALDAGCDKIVLLLALPKDHFRSGKGDAKTAEKLKKYPKAAERAAQSSNLYNKQLEQALELEKEGRVLIIAPQGFSKMKALEKDKAQIMKIYEDGYRSAEVIKDFLR